jgi:hypothetical protein
MLTWKIRVGYAQDLIRFRAMDETLLCQRIGLIPPVFLRGGPSSPGGSVQDEFAHGFNS